MPQKLSLKNIISSTLIEQTKLKTMKTLFNFKSMLLIISIMIVSTTFSKQMKDPISDDDLIQVVTNFETGNARINWKDNRIETIEITSSNGQFMPTIPVMGASELHLNDLINGTYTIVFKSNDAILYTKTIEINR